MLPSLPCSYLFWFVKNCFQTESPKRCTAVGLPSLQMLQADRVWVSLLRKCFGAHRCELQKHQTAQLNTILHRIKADLSQ